MSRKIKRQTKHYIISELDYNCSWKSVKVKAKDLTRLFSSVWIGIPLGLKTGEEYKCGRWKAKRIK